MNETSHPQTMTCNASDPTLSQTGTGLHRNSSITTNSLKVYVNNLAPDLFLFVSGFADQMRI